VCRLRDSFRRSGRRLYCSEACRQAAWRRRSQAPREPIVTKPDTVYQCPMCDARLIASSTARSATASPAGWAQAATVLVVTSRSRSQSSSSRNSSRHVRVKRRHEGGDQRAGIEGRSPRSHPQVLTISQCRPCPLLSHRMPEVGESSPLCGEIRAVQVGRNRQHCRRLRPERSIATSVRNNVP